jgi:hypothetical protein
MIGRGAAWRRAALGRKVSRAGSAAEGQGCVWPKAALGCMDAMSHARESAAAGGVRQVESDSVARPQYGGEGTTRHLPKTNRNT